ncbi:diacylglycerol kinase family protein [Rubrivirga sp. S365]|uniref:Diacylglycerol kinase family protein n=1 Tax=Rubrivirga litoralis TaxID=3075598 RepID=A0ABU3BUV4_9BACT|nr:MULTISPECIES: diacylglycerol kinase family protein [unclassified Rubrivirga]MDT0633068.1 diacylglycerol kinase family protein [Rubrivirga sp. F394]MDT7857135.1 diacylglycerol kinase family protein [Rubrivirga sp. S365]
MRVGVLITPASGAATRPMPDEIAAAFERAGAQATVRTVGGEGDDALAAHVRRAAAESDVVVAAGGDGTVRAVAEALAGGAVPMGVLPMGTFNHFARGLGLPTELAAAAQTIREGVARPVSAGRAGGRLFLNNAALGLAPDVVVQRRESHGSRLGRVLATVPVALGALLHMDRLRLDADLDGRRASFETPFVFATPNRYAPSLFQFGVLDRRTDGSLNVYVATPDGPVDALRVGRRLLRGRLDRHLDASVAERVELAADEPRVRVLMDGDVVRLPSPVVIEGVPDAVRVVGPAAPSAG